MLLQTLIIMIEKKTSYLEKDGKKRFLVPIGILLGELMSECERKPQIVAMESRRYAKVLHQDEIWKII